MSDSGKRGQAPDADLCAYLDDECGPGQRRRADSALTQDPALARKLAVWRRNDSTLRAAFSAQTQPARAQNSTDPPIGPLESGGAQKRRMDLAIAAAFLAGALSAGGAFVVANLIAN